MGDSPEIFAADDEQARWAKRSVESGHYLRAAPDPRTRPLCYVVSVAGELVGCMYFGRPEATRCYRGGLTYGSLDDMTTGRAAYDRWEVLNLSRVWLSPDVQRGGRLYSSKLIPGFVDRRGAWRSSLASHVIHLALACVGYDYLMRHPPVFLEQPYSIRAVLSYCDTRLHRGVIYAASGFHLARRNEAGIETWWTPNVGAMTCEQDRAVRELSDRHPRSQRIRNASGLPESEKQKA